MDAAGPISTGPFRPSTKPPCQVGVDGIVPSFYGGNSTYRRQVVDTTQEDVEPSSFLPKGSHSIRLMVLMRCAWPSNEWRETTADPVPLLVGYMVDRAAGRRFIVRLGLDTGRLCAFLNSSFIWLVYSLANSIIRRPLGPKNCPTKFWQISDEQHFQSSFVSSVSFGCFISTQPGETFFTVPPFFLVFYLGEEE